MDLIVVLQYTSSFTYYRRLRRLSSQQSRSNSNWYILLRKEYIIIIFSLFLSFCQLPLYLHRAPKSWRFILISNWRDRSCSEWCRLKAWLIWVLLWVAWNWGHISRRLPQQATWSSGLQHQRWSISQIP